MFGNFFGSFSPRASSQDKSNEEKNTSSGGGLSSVWNRFRGSSESSTSTKNERILSNMSVSETKEHFRRLVTEKVFSCVSPILTSMLYHKCNQGIFNQPVDPVRLNIPTYTRAIKNPMDLGTVRQKLDAGEYENIDDFADDVRLTFKNAIKFNPEKHPVHTKAKMLLQCFEDVYLKAKTKFIQTQKQMRLHSCELCYGGKVCNYCLRKCEPLDAPVILCDLCHGRIPHRSYYYRVNGCTQSWCAKCFVKSGASRRVYVMFERGVREYHLLILSRECQLYHSFTSQENLSKCNAQMHTQMVRKLEYQRSNTGTNGSRPRRRTRRTVRRFNRTDQNPRPIRNHLDPRR